MGDRKPTQRIATRKGAERAIIAALRPLGFEVVAIGTDQEPLLSLRMGPSKWFDLTLSESDGYPDALAKGSHDG